MKPSIRFLFLNVLTVVGIMLTAFRPLDRDVNQVTSLLIGEWKIVNLVVEPGKPFPGTIEEEELLKKITRNVLDNSASTVFVFHSNQQFEVVVPKEYMAKAPKSKSTWEIIQEGDVLLVKSKKEKDMVLKILDIEENYLELLSDTAEERVLYIFKKN